MAQTILHVVACLVFFSVGASALALIVGTLRSINRTDESDWFDY